MKKYLFLYLFFPTLALAQTGERYYVRPTALGQNNGSSWADAFTNLHNALALAMPGDEIWTAEGTYKPSESGDRDAFFKLPSGVRLYGGFAGHEFLLDERQWAAHPSVLSGDLGMAGNSADNSRNLLVAIQPDGSTVLDGWVLRDANADKAGPTLFAQGANGGALWVEGANGPVGLVVRHCRFEDNQARLGGGAVCVRGSDAGETTPLFEDCVFVGNKASTGGAICLRGGGRIDRPYDIKDCRFEGNSAANTGGALYFRDAPDGTDTLDVIGCVFEGNKSSNHGAVLAFGAPRIKHRSVVSIINVKFLKNDNIGGELLFLESFWGGGYFSLLLDSCRFEENRTPACIIAESEGEQHVLVQKCAFINGNNAFSCAYFGGDNLKSKLSVKSCFFDNGATGYIAADNASLFCQNIQSNTFLGFSLLCSSGDSVIIENCALSGRSNAIYECIINSEKISKVENCLFSGVLLESFGVNGRLERYVRSSSFVNVAFSPIFAPTHIPLYNTLIYNTNIWDNQFTMQNCVSSYPYPACLSGQNNRCGVDPLLRDTAAGDYRPLPCSPAVDAGSNAFVSPGLLTDLAGAPRIQLGTVDVGAYESEGFLPPLPIATKPNCAGQTNGVASVRPAGGCPPYKVRWSNGAVDTLVSGLLAGTYTVTVTDSKGRSAVAAVPLGASDPQLSASGDSLTCAGIAGGHLLLSVGGPFTPPLRYRWADGNTAAERLQLSTGTYRATVTDASGCTDVLVARVRSPLAPYVDTLLTPASGPLAQDGALDLTISGLYAPYAALWDNGTIGEDLSQVSPGIYTLTVTDGEGCTYVFPFEVPYTVAVQDAPIEADGTVWPNPAAAQAQVSFANSDRWRLFTVEGKEVRRLSKGQGTVDVSGLPAGLYWYVFEREGRSGKRGRLVVGR